MIRTVAPSSATRARSFWIKRASNPIPRKRALTACAGNGFKSATSPRPPCSTALTRARWRGLWRQSIQDYLIAAIQNLRIIAKNHKHLLLALTRILAKAKLLPIFFAADH